jgi:hypothetical protein
MRLQMVFVIMSALYKEDLFYAWHRRRGPLARQRVEGTQKQTLKGSSTVLVTALGSWGDPPAAAIEETFDLS